MKHIQTLETRDMAKSLLNGGFDAGVPCGSPAFSMI